MDEIKSTSGTIVKTWAPVTEVESQALDQLKETANMPWIHSHLAAMPDVHWGQGATIGSVVALDGAISPAAVGTDIGCGVSVIRTSVQNNQLPRDLKEIRMQIERDIPVGFNKHTKPVKITMHIPHHGYIKNIGQHPLWKQFESLPAELHDRIDNAKLQIGTLGGGNHFIEICLDKSNRVWIMLHSGSRNIGKLISDYYVKKARLLPHNKSMGALGVFLEGEEHFEDFCRDITWAQEYAYLNRQVMLELTKNVIQQFFDNVSFDHEVHCHHNYATHEEHFGKKIWLTRKGAISAEKGQLGIIPSAMGKSSYIVSGLGNPESFNSASHGAGRIMSRGKAKRAFTVEDLKKQTEGVECRKDKGVLDEIPGAYKDIDKVMENQKDLVEIVTEIKAVICVKG